MKAVEFVKKFGWDYARHVVNNHKEYMSFLGDTSLIDLKKLIEAKEFIMDRGGIDNVKNLLNTKYHCFDIDGIIKTEEALKLVESVENE